LKSNCYGNINYEDEIKELWKKKLTLKYITWIVNYSFFLDCRKCAVHLQ
jgi:hypothetical protein